MTIRRITCPACYGKRIAPTARVCRVCYGCLYVILVRA